MTPSKANLINAISLISMGFWGYLNVSSPTALIPVVFGSVLLLCYFIVTKKPESTKIVAHIALLFTLIIDSGGLGLARVLVMISTCSFAILVFIKSFIDARRN